MRGALLAVIAGAGLMAPLLWRPGLPWPGSLAVADADLVQQLPRDLLLEHCHDNQWLPFADGELRAALLLAARPDSVLLEATVWSAWGAPWQMQVFERDGRSYVGRFEITNWDSFSVPPDPSGAGHARPAPLVRLTETPISASTASKLQKEWQRSIGSAQANQTSGRDGVSYFFRIDDACATTWSPGEGSRNAALTRLLDAVAHGGDDTRLGVLLDAIPPPAKHIPWPPGAASSD